MLYQVRDDVFVVCSFEPVTQQAIGCRIINAEEARKLRERLPTDFTVAGLVARLDISRDSLRSYAKEAGVTRLPGRGGKSFKYAADDVVAICRWMIANGKSVEAAESLLNEIL